MRNTLRHSLRRPVFITRPHGPERVAWFVVLLLALGWLVGGVRPAAAANTDDLVLTKEGVPLKVVVRNPSAIYEQPEKKGNNKPAKMFDFFYVLKPGAGEPGPTKNGFYHVGAGTSAKEDALGWVPKEDVVEWPHREALGFRPIQGRDLAEFYSSEKDLRAAYGGPGNGGAANGGADPAGGAGGKAPEPQSKEPQGSAGVHVLPILRTFEMKQGGDSVQGYEVAYLHGKGVTANKSSVGTVDLSRATLDVVFVIDTTASMGPFIEATKEVVSTIAKQLAEESKQVPIRFGLVAYRDVIQNPPADWYVDRLYCDLEQGKDLNNFQQVLSQVREAEVSSEDIPEDVLAGLNCAITGQVDGKPARPATGNAMKWNPDGFKAIVLIGDASGQVGKSNYKNKYKLDIETVLKKAQPVGTENVREKVVLHTARILNPNQTEDYDTCKQQFTQLAQGRDGANAQGLALEFDGKPGEHKEFIDSLVKAIAKQQQGVEDLKRGKAPTADTPGWTVMLEMLRASGEGGQAGQGSAPSFADGFACEVDRKGNQMLEPRVLVQRGQLDNFIAAIDFFVSTLRNAGDPGSKDAAQVLKNLQFLLTSLSINEPVDANTPLATVLKYASGIPVKSKAFDVTIQKLVNMTQADFEKWVNEVDSSTKVIHDLLARDSMWFSLGDTDQAPAKRHGFVAIKDLP